MAISAKDVMGLRQRTGLGMMDCKKALTETSGNVDAAIELLRKKLKGKMEERSDRDTTEGIVAVAKSPGAIAMIELTCETDFVARNEAFSEAATKIAQMTLEGADGPVEATDEMKQLVEDLKITIQENISLRQGVRLSGSTLGSYVHHNHKIGVVIKADGGIPETLLTGVCQHICAAVPTPLAVDESSLPPEELDRQRTAAIDEAKASGKPEQIAEKIATGKLRKWVDENTLMGQIYLRELDAKKPVRDYLSKGMAIKSFFRYRLGR